MNKTNRTTCLALSAALFTATAVMAAAAKPVKIFILSGQSNMTGRGALGDLKKPAEDQKATLVRFIMAPENVEKYKFLYEKNLVNLVTDLRKDVKAPAMKIVVATTGFGGRELTGFTKDAQKEAIGKVISAQMALPTRPEFKGVAAVAETRDFYRPQAMFGGNKQTIHWHANGESYWLMGEAMGREMVKLLGQGK